jgi:hypothetical protein
MKSEAVCRLNNETAIPGVGGVRGVGLSLACSSTNAHHNQSPISSCADKHCLYLSLFLLQMLTIFYLLLLLAQRRMNLSHACTPTDAHHTQSPIISCAAYQMKITPSRYCQPRYLSSSTILSTSLSIRLGL